MSTYVSLLSPVSQDIQEVEDLMRSQANGNHADLRAALNLLLSSGGKRIRPTMTMLVGRMLGANHRQLVTLAASLELLHTATLVHDDLIDHSMLRRGVPTLNSKWSAGATVLTGDFLFARAAFLAAQTESIPVMKVFSNTLSTIVNGEIAQLFNSRCTTERSNYYARIYSKTASLFETAAWSAAQVSPASDEITESMKQYGYEVGMAFQIVDDILDFTSEQSALGKPIGSDMRQGLITLPAIYYIETNPSDSIVQQILSGECPTSDDGIDHFVKCIRDSSAIQNAYEEAQEHIDRAKSLLYQIDDCPERASLIDLASYIVDRKN